MNSTRHAGLPRRRLPAVVAAALAWASVAAATLAPAAAAATPATAAAHGAHRQHGVAVHRPLIRARHRATPARAHASIRHHSR